MKLPQIEISVKFKGAKKAELTVLRTSKDVVKAVRSMFNADQIEWTEEFVMLCLNSQNSVIGYYKISRGGMTSAVADVRVVATVALQSMATNVIIAHNHPSGSLTPSTADNHTTQKIKNALELLDIRLLDHIIVTADHHLSYSDEGLL
jgi:DNA repair protein RadC